jgi:hypothetical protein
MRRWFTVWKATHPDFKPLYARKKTALQTLIKAQWGDSSAKAVLNRDYWAMPYKDQFVGFLGTQNPIIYTYFTYWGKTEPPGKG